MENYAEKLKNNLQIDGKKFTKSRKEIVNCVSNINEHFDADDIYDKLKKDGKNISRASVYRTIPILLKNKIIKEASIYKKRTKYEVIKENEHHDHIICKMCEKIIEFKNDEIEKLQKTICKKYDFVLIEHNMELKGYCSKCYKKLKRRKNDNTTTT